MLIFGLPEFYGRQILFFITYMALTAFNAGAAGAKNIESLVILRFFAGAFGSSPLTNAGGVIADLFVASDRGLATAVFATAPFLGPSIGKHLILVYLPRAGARLVRRDVLHAACARNIVIT